MMIRAFLSLLTVVLSVVGSVRAEDPASGSGLHPRVKMETSQGDIVLELDGEKAPITVQNFIQYVEDGFYDETVFHRVMSNFMIQGGGATKDLENKTGQRDGIKNEWRNGLKNIRGTIAMARLPRQPDSARAQFFINVENNPQLDRPRDGAGFAVFGKVVEGMDVVDVIRKAEVKADPKGRPGEKSTPVDPVVIKSVKVVSDYDRDKVAALVKTAKKEADQAQASADAARQKELDDFIAKTEAQTEKKFSKTDSGLMYMVLQEGTGDSPQATDTVKVHYTGWLVNGTKFDSSVDRGTPTTFALNGVIKGWTEGVGMMKVGAKWKFLIPPDLGYGARGAPRIPANSHLVFDVELLGIEQAGN